MQQTTNHQLMGYDRAITLFSPDGRLLQVEYARKTVKQGSTTIGFVCKDGILIVADKRVVDPLIVADSIEKAFIIDNHIIGGASGILSDARILVARAQVEAQKHRITYGTDVDIISVLKDICDLKQFCTQSGGLRPFGVSLLIGGLDENKPVLYQTDPTGVYFQYMATAIGEFEDDVLAILYKEYNKDMVLDDALKLSLSILKKVLAKNFDINRIDTLYLKIDEKTPKKFDKDYLDSLSKKVKSL